MFKKGSIIRGLLQILISIIVFIFLTFSINDSNGTIQGVVPYIFIGIFYIAAIISFIQGFIDLRNGSKSRHVQKNGYLSTGKIIKMFIREVTSTDQNGGKHTSYYYTIEFKYTGQDGNEYFHQEEVRKKIYDALKYRYQRNYLVIPIRVLGQRAVLDIKEVNRLFE